MPDKTSDCFGQFSLSYSYPGDKDTFIYMKIPKFFQTDSRFKNLSVNAIYLYASMRDKASYASTINQVDENGRVYIDYSLEETCKLLRCGSTTAKKIRKELRDCFGENNGLIRFVPRGQGKNDYVYVLNYLQETALETPDSKICPSGETHFEPSRETHSNPSRKTDFATYYKTNKENDNKNNIYHLSFTNQSLRKTDDDKHFSFSPVSAAMDSTPDRYTTALDDFKTQIGYEQLLCYTSDKTTLIDDMVGVMAQEYISRSEETIINGRHYSRSAIIDCLKSIDLETAKYVLDCLCRNNTKVVNIQRYILATLLNAPTSFKAQKAYEDQVTQNRFLSHDTGPIYVKPTIKRSYEPYQGRNYTDEEIHAFELKKLGITG